MTTAIDYDDLPYHSVAMAETHPSRLGGIAHLCGLRTTPAGTARVLELGCAGGGNIVPMAGGLPGATFVGIDFSATHIDAGQSWVASLGLKNCTLVCADIGTVKLEQQFDYIIAHGVYSWIEQDVRDSLLQICVDCLTPQGVAYVSYNTLPGWRLRQVTRDFMLFHSRHAQVATDRLSSARNGIEWLADHATGAPVVYQQLLKEAAARNVADEDSYLFHEYLEGVNQPLYFSEFVEQANRFGLDYLSEARLRGSLAAQLNGMGLPDNLSSVEQEQYSDFLAGRQFRRSILRRSKDRVDPERCNLNELTFSAISELMVDDQPAGGAEIRFDGGRSTVGAGTACNLLRQFASHWPETLSLAQLSVAGDADSVTTELKNLVVAGIVVVELDTTNTSRRQLTPRPCADRVARLQAEAGQVVTNLRHENIRLNLFQSKLLSLLDGSRTHKQIVAWVADLLKAGTISVEGGNKGPEFVARVVDNQLQTLALMALLY